MLARRKAQPGGLGVLTVEGRTRHPLYSLFVILVRLLLLILCLWLAGCTSIPDTYAPPVQRKPLTGPEPSPIGHFVTMSAPNAEAHFVRDVSRTLEGGAWRWVFEHPEFIFRLPSTRHLRFSMDFAIPEMTFRQRGPVTISIFINGHLLDKTRYERGGQLHFEKPVPPEWLRTDIDNVVAMEIDKPWIAPEDGKKLGFILTGAGFIQ